MNYRNRFKSFIRKPHNVILVTLAVILFYLTIVPMITIILDTFTVHQSELMRVKGARAGDFPLSLEQGSVFFGEPEDLLRTLQEQIGKASCRERV